MHSEIRIISSHVDKHNEQISLNALQDLANLFNKQYTPMGIEHDPRNPPVGRVLSASIKELDDGEFAVDGIAETYEKGEDVVFKDDGREIPLHDFGDQLCIKPDRSYQNPEDQSTLAELESLVNGEITPQLKKAEEPISLLILAATFIAGGIASGFLSKIGEDAWDQFKAKLIELMSRKKLTNKERLLDFEFTVREGGQLLCLETILTNPAESDIVSFLREGLERLDTVTPRFFKHRHYLSKIVFEYKGGRLRIIYGLRKDAVPVSMDIDG